jgi:hypothetical protein
MINPSREWMFFPPRPPKKKPQLNLEGLEGLGDVKAPPTSLAAKNAAYLAAWRAKPVTAKSKRKKR